MTCPACHAPLNVRRIWLAPAGGGPNEPAISVWCGNPRCPSDASNRGATGADESEAAERLRETIESEGWE